MVTQGEASKEPKDAEVESQISSKEELEEVNLRVDLRNPKWTWGQLSIQENEQWEEFLKKYEDVFGWTYDEMLGLDPRLVIHSFNIEPRSKPVIQPAKVFHTEAKA